jgi:nucleotidyltransferase/DNA polymerase involved in DNA repair
MVDSAINWLFVDLNSYFASIEQELCPELRGQPIAIVPIRVEAQTGCCIAVRQAGPRVAAILSVVESCRRLKVPVRDYLADILPGLANTSIQRVAELTPADWIARHTHANL